MKKLGILILVVVVALGALGVGYAQWSQTLIINANVNTGSLDAQFLTPPAWVTVDGDGAGVGTISASKISSYVANVSIGNAYPGYTASANLVVKNTGTIPANMALVEISNPSGYFSASPASYTNVAPGATVTFTVSFAVPSTETGNEGASFSATYNITASQP